MRFWCALRWAVLFALIALCVAGFLLELEIGEAVVIEPSGDGSL